MRGDGIGAGRLKGSFCIDVRRRQFGQIANLRIIGNSGGQIRVAHWIAQLKAPAGIQQIPLPGGGG